MAQPRDSSMSSASVSSSVNGLIQQSFQWLDVDEDSAPTRSGPGSDIRPPSLAPPNPAFRSDRSLNLRAVPPSTSPTSPASPGSSPANAISPPSRGASMQSASSASTASSSASQATCLPLFPSPPRAGTPTTATSPGAIQEADRPSDLVYSPRDQHSPRNHERDPAQHDNQHLQALGREDPQPRSFAAPSPPPPIPLPPSPSTSTIRRAPRQQQDEQEHYPSLQQGEAHDPQTGAANPHDTRHLYDSPYSPALPSSPGFPPSSPRLISNSPQHDYPQFQQAPHPRQVSSSSSHQSAASYSTVSAAAAGIPLPSSPFNAQYAALPNHPYPARTASIAHSDRSYHQPQQPYQQYQQQHSPSPTRSGFAPAQTRAGAGAGGVLGYASSSPSPRGAYTHANATESTIWGGGSNNGDFYSPKGTEYDEKGFYNDMNGGNEGSALAKKAPAAVPAVSRGNRKKWWIIGGIVVFVVGAAIIGVVVYLTQRKSKDTVAQNSASDSANGSSKDKGATSNTGASDTTANPGKPNGPATSGGDGSTITMENGQTFTYRNQFGGTWSSVPFDDSARAQSWSPALNERWDYSTDKIYGVNIGGWLHTEPFIAPALYEPFADSANPAVDEWTLSEALGDDLHDTMVEHFETFITEEDFAQIAGAGLNWVRIAIPFWAIEVYPGEPFLEGVCWQYFLKAITWARKYGLRINLDLHTIPGSQNGWNHSGKMGSIGFLNGAMGMANAQRTMNYIRILTEFINQPEYRNVIPMWGIINEAQGNVIGDEVLRAFYLEVYDMIREITGVGEGNGPVISIHDGFSGNLSTWNGFLTGSDRIVMDSHPYLAFDEPNADPYPVQMLKACDRWGPMFNLSMANVGFTYAGEFSLGVNDCGQYLNGVIDGMRFDGTYTGFENVTGSCDLYMDVSLWDADFKAQVLDFALASMDTFQNWFFWTWKIGKSTVYNRVATPMWSYSLGLQEGYIPADPRAYHGSCPAMAEKYGLPAPESVHFDGSLEPWMTGGAGAGQILPTQLASYSQWPPVSMANIPLIESLDVAELPTYTATATDLTLTGSPTPTTGRVATPILTSPYFTPIAGCTNYLDAWGAAAATPTGTC